MAGTPRRCALASTCQGLLPLVLSSIVLGISSSLVVFYLILGVDRILDMCRTCVNVTGDLTAVTIMDRWLGKSKQKAGETEGETGGLSPSAAP